MYLSEADLARAAKFVGMSRAAFERKYVYRTRNRMRLRVPRRAHCHFLYEGGCSIHEAKPTQCRIFPFWPELVDHPTAWAKKAKYCPGIVILVVMVSVSVVIMILEPLAREEADNNIDRQNHGH